MLHRRFIIIKRVVRGFSRSCRLFINHYDALGITPKASQNEIKTAYYKLSKVHHPDKSKDEESAKTFRAIKEAYEVLGNIKLKQMYDKGLSVGKENTSRMHHHHKPEPEPTDPTLRFYKSRSRRHMVPSMDGKTPIYDFDTWSRNHYGEMLNKAKQDKDLVKHKLKKKEDAAQAFQQETFLIALIALGGLFMMFVINGTPDYDQDKMHNIKKKEV